MSGSKNKVAQLPTKSVPKAVAKPATAPMAATSAPLGPTTPTPPAGELELLASQLNTGYPSIPYATTLANLQKVYAPVVGPGPQITQTIRAQDKAAAKAKVATPAKATTAPAENAPAGRYEQPGMINDFGGFIQFLMNQKNLPKSQR